MVASTRPHDLSAKALAGASITNSLLLPVVAALHLNVAFWALVLTNFVVFHAIWLAQLVRHRSWVEVDWGWQVYRWPLPLLAFVLLGCLSFAIWGTELMSVFPS